MDHEELLAVGGHVPGRDGTAAEVGVRHRAFGQGRIDVAQADPSLVGIQEAVFVGRLGFHRDGTLEHVVVYPVVDALLGTVRSGRIPHNGCAYVLVVQLVIIINSPIAQLFSLIDERFSWGGEEHGTSLFFLVQIPVQVVCGTVERKPFVVLVRILLGFHAGLVVVGHEERGDGLGTGQTPSFMIGDIADNR